MRQVSRTPYVLLCAYLALSLFCLIWPGYAWLGARVEPFVFGLPFAFAWHIFWVLATCIVLIAFHRSVGGRA